MERVIKQIGWLLSAMVIAMTVSGCGGGGGGNDKPDSPPQSEISLNTTKMDLNTTSKKFTLHVEVVKKPGVKVKMSNFSLYIPNCDFDGQVQYDPSTLELPDAAQNGSLDVRGAFEEICFPTSYTLSWHEKQTYEGQTKEFDASQSADVGTDSGGGTGTPGDYKLFVFPDRIEVTQGGQSVPFTVQLGKYNQDGLLMPAGDEKLSIEVMDPRYGTITPMQGQTDSNGRVSFTYLAPTSLRGLAGAHAFINIFMTNRTDNREQIEVVFENQVKDLYLAPQVIDVTKAGAEQNITLVTVDGHGYGIGAEIKIQQLNNGDGNDYGSLSDYHPTIGASGSATIVYTAPGSIDNQPDRNITVHVVGTQIEQNLTFRYIKNTQEIPYEIGVAVPNTMGIKGHDAITVTIHAIGNPDEKIGSSQVDEVNVSVKHFSNMLKLPAASDGKKLSYSGENPKQIQIDSNTIAGVAIIDITARVTDKDGNPVDLNTSVPITIMSGPIASLTIVYAGTREDGLLYDQYIVHAVDKYGNPVNTGDKIHPSLICGGAENNSSDPISIVGYNGTIDGSSGATIFEDTVNSPFGATTTNERLMILPWNGANQNAYLGDWTIENVDSDSQLTLQEKYFADAKDHLLYVVGDQDRVLNGNVATADISAAEGYEDYKVDQNGLVKLEVKYDPALVGHTFSLGVNSYSEDNRSGAAAREAFRGVGYNWSASPDPIKIDGNDHDVTLTISIKPDGTWLDHVTITPSSITFDSTQCSLNGSPDNFHVSGGQVRLSVSTQTGDDKECKLQWNPSNASLIYEY